MVEAAHDAALQQRPEAVDGSRVDEAAHVFALGVLDGLMGKIARQVDIAAVLIGGDQADLLGHCGADEMAHRAKVGLPEHAGNDRSLPLNSADHDLLADAAGAGRALVPMPVLVLAADVGLVNLNDTHQLAELGIDATRRGCACTCNEPSCSCQSRAPAELARAATPFFAVNIR